MDIVHRGERPKASTLNGLNNRITQQTLRPNQIRTSAAGILKDYSSGILCQAENVGATTLQVYDAVVICGQAHSPNYSPEAKGICVQVRRAEAGDNLGNVAVCLTPMNANATGTVVISGAAWVNVTGTGLYGNLTVDDTHVVLGASGSVAVLFDTGTGIALIRFPVGGAGGGGTTPMEAHWHVSARVGHAVGFSGGY